MHDQIAPIPVWSGEEREGAWSEPLAAIVAGPGETQMLFMGDRAVHAGNGERRRRRATGQGGEDSQGPVLDDLDFGSSPSQQLQQPHIALATLST